MLRLHIYILIIIIASSTIFAEDSTKTIADPNDDFTTLKLKLKKALVSETSKEDVKPAGNPEIDNLLSTLNDLKLPSDPEWIKSVEKKQSPAKNTKDITPTKDKAIAKPKTETLKDLKNSVKKLKDDSVIIPIETSTDISELYATTMAYSEYMSKDYKDSAKFYNIALNQLDKKANNYNNQRSWYIFQLGNCYKHFDSTKASDTFSQLINEYPNSKWSDFARVELKLLRTFRDNDIDRTLMNASELLSNLSSENSEK